MNVGGEGSTEYLNFKKGHIMKEYRNIIYVEVRLGLIIRNYVDVLHILRVTEF